jgi:acyl carrier protein
MENIEKRIRDTVSKVTNLAADAPGDADLYFDLGVSSVHAIALLTGLEEGFGVTVPDGDFVEATSINKLTHVITGLLNASAGS